VPMHIKSCIYGACNPTKITSIISVVWPLMLYEGCEVSMYWPKLT
jgi:hypothetical protein